MSVRIYVEGGGDRSITRSQCREGFAAFFQKVVRAGFQPKIIAAGSGQEAYDDFGTALRQQRDAFVVLLVDSEGPVNEFGKVWEHLKSQFNWERPEGAAEDQAHLMVQCMEAWFLADPDALACFYSQGFLRNSLPKRGNVEEVPKRDVFGVLAHATRNTKTKGEYHKTHHGFTLLARVDPSKVCKAAPHADRLVSVIVKRCSRT